MNRNVSECEFTRVMAQEEHGFSYQGAKALYAHFLHLEEECGCAIDFDPIAHRSEYTEYEDLEEFQANYGEDYETIEDIERCTMVIKIDEDSFIIQDF